MRLQAEVKRNRIIPFARRDRPGSYLRRQDLAACEAGVRRFMEMFESSSDDVAASFCALSGLLSGKREEVAAFDEACKARDL